MPKNIAIKTLITLCAFYSLVIQAATKTNVICSYAPSQNIPVAAISSLFTGASAGTISTLYVSGITLVPHSSGAPIMTGAAGYIAGTMPGAITTTQIITAGALVGTTVVFFELACVPINYSEKLNTLADGTKAYSKEALIWLSDAPNRTWNMISNKKYEAVKKLATEYKTLSVDAFYKLMGETWYERAYRKTKNAFKS